MGGAMRPFYGPSGKRYLAGGKVTALDVERSDVNYLLSLQDSQERKYFQIPPQSAPKAQTLPAYLMAQPSSPFQKDAAQNEPDDDSAGLTIDAATEMNIDELRLWINENTDMNADEIERSDEREDLPPRKSDLIEWLVGMEIAK
jgi:hypothetical protein